jgi:hypothetical protein
VENSTDEILGYLFYYLIFFLIVLLALGFYCKIIIRKEFLLAITCLLVLIAAFRAPNVDKDYTTYINSFSLVGSPLDYFINYSQWNYLEPFYYLIPSVVKSMNVYYYDTILFFIFSSIGVSIKIFSVSKLSKNLSLALITYFSFYFFLHEMTQMRAGIASGGLLICTYCYYEKKLIPFFVVLIFSMCFQYTGILILLLLLLDKKRFNASFNILLLMLSFVFILFKINVINEFFFRFNLPFTDKLLLTLKTLTQKENGLNPFNVVYLISILLQMWLFVNHKKISSATPYGILLLKIQLIGFIFFGIFSNVAVVAFRLYEFFGVVSIITSTYLTYTIKNKVLSNTIVVVYNFLLLINLLHVTKLISSYDFIFFHD